MTNNLDPLRHSAAHLLAAAVLKLYPGTKRAIGPATPEGFYYDFEFNQPITEDDLKKIEKEMEKIVQGWKTFEKKEVNTQEAKKIFANEPYKIELINDFSNEGQTLTIYTSGDYTDLCKGGHSETPSKELRHFKLLKIAGAYWKGNEKNKMLTRIYGTAFLTKEELVQHLNDLEEAKKRDHKKLGKELGIYMQAELVGKGLPIWLPKGNIIKEEVENYAIETEKKAGYVRVTTPHLAKKELFETSGHLPYYAESMYPPMIMDDGTYYLKAMNCPFHHLIYKNNARSYRELPLRIAEYGTVYRNELSGTLSGLLRVRSLAMNDAHIYCTKDQIEKEFKNVMSMIVNYYDTFGLKNFWFRLSKRDANNKEKYIDEPESWNYTEEVLRNVLTELKVNYVEVEDEAAFYGPKVDIQYKAVTGREETMSTVQLDFAAKKRFELSYIDNEGKENNELYVIHRAPLSTHERFMAFLIEHYSGRFPLWLSPVQVKILTVTDRNNEYAQRIGEKMNQAGIRVEYDSDPDTISKKVRTAELEKIPLILTIGDKEVEKNTLAIRHNGKNIFNYDPEKFITKLLDNIKHRKQEIEF